MARVRELARAHCFDFASTETTTTLKLRLRFDGLHVVELKIPFSGLEEMLPRFEASLPMLVHLAKAGLDAHVRPNYASRARYVNWVTHQSLGADEVTTC